VARPLRYTFILALVALGATLAAVGGWRYARASAPVPGPIILITIDTLRADHLPAYGYRNVTTPSIDALARDGIVFERAYSHAVQTLPAHVALLSGRFPFDTGVRDDGVMVKPNVRLLAQMLRDRGYATGGIVSSGMLRRDTGIAHGFDFFNDPATGSGAPPAETTDDASTVPGLTGAGQLQPAVEPVPPATAELTAGEVRRDGAESEAIAERWLDSVGSTRLFLFLQLHEPHAPYVAPERFGQLAPYDGAIAYADEIVGRLVQYLKTHQLYDQSTIVLVSDHGEGLGDHGEQEHGLFLYDETIHVPLIIKQAGGADAGRRVTDLVQHADIVPTVLDLVKAPVPGNLRGQSLKSLADGTGDRADGQNIYAESSYGRNRFGWSALASLTDGRHQYIRAPREELYDLRNDPRQRENTADDVLSRSPIEKRRLELRRLLGEEESAAGRGDDPKDKRDTVEQYRAARTLVAERKWPQAIETFQKILRDEPDAARVWSELANVATLAERHAVALDAWQHVIALEPGVSAGHLGAARASLELGKLEDAQQHGIDGVEAAGTDAHQLADAHAVLATIALERHDADAARREAALVRESDETSAWPLYADARLLYDEGYYAEALPLLEQANAEMRKTRGAAILDLHYVTGSVLLHAGRHAEAERQLREELRSFPHNLCASATLASLYQSTGQLESAARVVSDLTRVTPTPGAYVLAAQLWTSLGDRKQAAQVRAEAQKAFTSRRAH
jgi:arylsulfatase A-like enzyme/Tfp pilus assembly protein PilF